jgi:hypothetical protein
VADHFAQIESQGEGQLVLRIDGESGSLLRRASDRVIPFLIQIDLDENSSGVDLADPARIVRTLLHVTVSPQRSRDRRRRDVLEKAQRLLASLKSYLLAQELKAGR